MGAAEARVALDAALREPTFYFPVPDHVRVIETHISTVYLAGDLALKVKKPLVLPFLDYGSLEQRRAMCEEEVRLNRRLAPGVYLGVRALVPDDSPIGWRMSDEPGDPEAAEYAVAMRRFDERHTLACLLDDDRARSDDLRQLGRRLARFHLDAPIASSAPGWPSHLERAVRENFETLADLPRGGISLTELAAGRRFAAAFQRAWADLIDERSTTGLVREGHGDLRAEHVLTQGGEFEVFDCIEFDPALREIDVAADLAFLVMDLAAAHRDDLAQALVEGYREGGGDPGPEQLVAFFASYRAWVRAKVDALRAGELASEGRSHPDQSAEAARLAHLARRLAWRARGPQLVLIGGPAASGKSFLASHLAAHADIAHLESDRVRKELWGLEPTERAPEAAYAANESERTYIELGRRAAGTLEAGRSVLVAATFRLRRDRDAFSAGVRGAFADQLFVECCAPATVLRERAQRRLGANTTESDAGPELALQQASGFEPPTEIEPSGRLVVRTDRPVEEVADEVEAGLDLRMGGRRMGENPQPGHGSGTRPHGARGAKLGS